MKNFTLALIVSLSLAFGFTSVKASELTKPETNNKCEDAANYIYVRVYEAGAIWVYVYTEDGIFVAKYVDL
jgi:hypothetical protein